MEISVSIQPKPEKGLVVAGAPGKVYVSVVSIQPKPEKGLVERARGML